MVFVLTGMLGMMKTVPRIIIIQAMATASQIIFTFPLLTSISYLMTVSASLALNSVKTHDDVRCAAGLVELWQNGL